MKRQFLLMTLLVSITLSYLESQKPLNEMPINLNKGHMHRLYWLLRHLHYSFATFKIRNKKDNYWNRKKYQNHKTIRPQSSQWFC